jgi:outer membrane protein assembly factor BamD
LQILILKMRQNQKKIFFTFVIVKKVIFLFFLVFGVSCSEYQKALKSEDIAVKFAQSEKLFDAGKHSKAIALFEQMAPQYRGKPQAEKMFYMYSQSLFKTKQYYTAAYQFEAFASSYPKSEKLEEAKYLGALCFSKLSPSYTLDQTDTQKAIEKFQSFIDEHPNSSYIAESNNQVKVLRDKIERKAYENAKEYNKISDHKSAIVALENFIVDYPGTIYKEKALYYKLESSYILAINSVPSKMEERLNAAKVAHVTLIKFNSNTNFKSKADEMLDRIEKNLKQFSK